VGLPVMLIGTGLRIAADAPSPRWLICETARLARLLFWIPFYHERTSGFGTSSARPDLPWASQHLLPTFL
jgi:hypothetical protein